MTWSGVLLVTAVVWAVSLIRSVRVRAFVYSLPLPMTLALVTTGHRVDGAQLLGVAGLNLFFGTVALTHHRWRWPIAAADLAGVAVYVAYSALLLAVAVPFRTALAVTLLLWTGAMVVRHRWPGRDPDPVEGRRDGLAVPVKLAVILAGSVCTGLFGHLLRGMVVTFPYAGVLVAVEARRHLVPFAWHFGRNSLALVGFLAAYHGLQDGPAGIALAGAWAAYALLATALHLPVRACGARPARRGGGRRRADGPVGSRGGGRRRPGRWRTKPVA